MKLFNCKFNNKIKNIYYNNKSNLYEIKQNIIDTFKLDVRPNALFLTLDKSKLLTNNNLHNLKTIEYIDVNIKLKGGIIANILNLLTSIIDFCKDLGTMLVELICVFLKALEMIPIIFDPPRLIDDIMYGVTYGINTVMGGVMGSVDPQKPSEEKQTSGPFGVNKIDKSTVCISPSLSVILLLILCPPLSIFYKYSFIKALIPSIICGVLCVKLYYFPGLLFASLMVLC